MRRYGYNGEADADWESEAYQQAGVKPGDMVEAFGCKTAEGYTAYLVVGLDHPDIQGTMLDREDFVWVKEQNVGRCWAEHCPPDQIVKIEP